MATTISMVAGGFILVLGVAFVLISWLSLRGWSSAQATSLVVLFLSGLAFLMIGLFLVFVRKISKEQV
ncbi:MAG TPA: hypothetical protein VNE86_01085 [Nitrososphaerales archaeon]|nr:hypothetical protein [Nitrososphaerales archaeon]